MQQIINFWKKHATKDLVAAINQMSPRELANAFTGELEFGTAGIRGLIGPGPNQMNIYTVMKITYGYGKYLLAKYGSPAKVGVIIGTDNRKQKEDFSRIAAGVLMQMGIKVMKSLVVPTPLVTFTIKNVQAQGGIVITASHNLPPYNGIKLYDQDGGQLGPDEIKQVLHFANEHSEYLTYPYRENRMAIMPIVEPIIKKYLVALQKLAPPTSKANLKIVFSPLHGTAHALMPKLLTSLGHTVIPVAEQNDPDPTFKNAPIPNPEVSQAYQLGLSYLTKNQADLMLITDPDADRLGIMAQKDQKWIMLNGNQIALLIVDYLIKHRQIMPGKSTLITSYVGSSLVTKIAKAHKIKVLLLPIGFKWVSQALKKLPPKHFFFAFEDAHGYLIDPTISYDKDAFQAAVIISQIAQEAKNNQQSLWDVLAKIYQKHGFSYEITKTKSFANAQEFKKGDPFMTKLRQEGAKLIGQEGQFIDLKVTKENGSSMNAVKFQFAYGQIVIRPSGTEPKIKLYLQVLGENEEVLTQNKRVLADFIKKLPLEFQ